MAEKQKDLRRLAAAAGSIGAAFALTLAACGSDGGETAADGGSDDGAAAVTNACPIDGCTVDITEVTAEGGELRIAWETNFTPDFAQNHIHLYWDTYEAGQVSSDAESVHNTEQGNWVPTDVVPTFLTEGAASVEMREGSTRLCVVAANGDHAVLDVDAVDCEDVADLLS